MNKKILITGGAGYIGSHIVTILGNEKYDLVILDNLSTGHASSVHFGELVVGDLADHSFLDQLMEKHQFSAVIHFAGSIIVPESVTDPLKYYKNNTENSLNLIALCLKHKIKNFIFSSTAAVYGIPVGGVATEESDTNPINPYGRSKLITEWMLEDTSHAFDFNYVALRYFNVAGANIEGLVGQCSKTSTHLLKLASETALGKREALNVFGTDYETRDGTCIRDYIHVDDLAQAHLDALTYLEKGGKSVKLNCGYGEGFTVNEVVARVKEVTGVDFKVNYTGRRDGDPGVLMSQALKIKKVLNWKPKFNDLNLIIKTAVDWERKLK